MVACIKTALYGPKIPENWLDNGTWIGPWSNRANISHPPHQWTSLIFWAVSVTTPSAPKIRTLPPPHPRMKPCWFCYKLTFLRCQLPVGSDAALHWCILRKYCTGRKEKNLDLKEKGSDLSSGRSCSRLSRFSRRREQDSSFRSQICFYSGRHCLIPDGLEATWDNKLLLLMDSLWSF